MMITTLALAFSLTTLTEPPCSVPAEIFARAQTVGIATDLSGSTELYCEYHTNEEGKQTQVRYYRPTGELFAQKRLNYRHGAAVPEVWQKDERSGEMHEVRLVEQRWLLSYSENGDAKVKQKALSLKDVDVIDAGFDHAVRDHWRALVGGQSISLGFASTVSQRSLNLRITQRPQDQCPSIEAQAKCFWVEADNALVRLFVDPLQLMYNDQRQLVLFRGVVNIQNDAGEKQSAQIRYFHRQ